MARALVCTALLIPAATLPAQFTSVVNPGEFDNIQYWVGHGTNNGAVVLDFHDGKVTHSYGWGLRWEGVINGEDALRSIVEADPRLNWNTQQFAFGLAVYGITFDANGNGGEFIFTGSDGGSVGDPDDHLQNGFLTEGFWAYNTTEETPATDEWEGSMVGAGARFLSNGSWDGWAFAPGYDINPPRNPIVFVQPPRPFLGSVTLTDFTGEAPEGFTSQRNVIVEFTGAYGQEIRLSETSGAGDWMTLTGEPITFELSPGDGPKTVHATLRRENAVSDEVAASIQLASGYNFPSFVLPMTNPVVTDHLVFDITYEQPIGDALLADPFGLAGTLADVATFDTQIDDDPQYRVIVRLSDATVDGSIAITAPVFNAEGNVATTMTSTSYGIQNGAAQFATGDYNQDGAVNVADVTALANDIVNGTVSE
jgi:hypothetical protein